MVSNPALTASDRCDRCGAPAQARTMHDVTEQTPVYPKDTTTVGGTVPMLWCAHHLREHRAPLMPLLVWQTPEVAKSREPVAP